MAHILQVLRHKDYMKSMLTEGKMKSVKFIESHLNPNRREKVGKIVGLCGPGSEADRHVRDNYNRGYRLKNQIFVEGNPDVYSSLKNWQEASGFPGKIIFGELCEQITQLCESGEMITDVDADHTLKFGVIEQHLFPLIRKYAIPAISTTCSTRGNNKEFEILPKSLKLKQGPSRRSDGSIVGGLDGGIPRPALKYWTKEVAETYAHQIFKSSDYIVTELFGYKGVGKTGMATMCIYMPHFNVKFLGFNRKGARPRLK